MNRRLFHGQLADEIAGEDRPRAERLRRLARELIGIVREGLIREGQVRIHGFGTFRLRPTKAHKGVNPQTGETIDIPARNRVLFRPAKALRERIEPTAAVAVPLAEPHASREAVLGGVMSAAPAAGALPADGAGSRRHYFPDRIAAAAMAGSVAHASGPGPALGTRVSGSREANLGGAMGDTPSAGAVPPRETEDETAAPGGDAPATGATRYVPVAAGAPSREAALGTSGRIESPAAGALPADDLPPEAQEPDRPATVPAAREGPPPVASAPDEAGIELDAGASREAGLAGRSGGGYPAGGLPPEADERPEQASGFEAETPLRAESPPAGGPTREPAPAGLRESTLADRSAAGRPAGGLPEEVPPWDAEPGDRTGSGTIPATQEGPTRPAAGAGGSPPERPEGSREAVLGGRGARAGAAGALPEEAGPDSAAGPDWVEEPHATRPHRIVIDDDVESGRVPPPEEAEVREDRRDLRGLLLLLLLLIAALAWWFWPRTEAPVAPVADSGITSERTDTVVTDDAGDAAGTAATGAPEADVATAEPAESADPVEPAEAAETVETAAGGEAAAGADSATTGAPADAAPADGGDSAAAETVADAVIAGQAGAAAEASAAEPAATTTAEAAPETAAEPAREAAAGSAAGTSAPWFDGRSYAVRSGDTLWDLSDAHYVNPYYWPHIWNHNGDLGNPDLIEIDQVLWLPSLEGTPRSLTAADRRSIAEGYLRLYRLWRDTGAANPQYALVGVRYFDPSVLPPELENDPAAGRPDDALAAAFAALLEAEFPRQR